MAAIDIQALARRVETGDRSAETDLAQYFGRRVFAVLYARTRNAELARDLTQDTLLALITALRGGRVMDHENLTGFVLGTARNLVANHYRQEGRRAEQHALPDDLTAPPVWDSQAHRERNALIEKALRRLDPNEVQILRMTLAEDLNPAQIATRLGLTSEVVRQRKSRALKKVTEFVQRMQSQ